MITLTRNTELKSGVSIKHDKMKVIFNFLYEFQFSNIDNLAVLLGSTPPAQRRFLSALVEDGYLTKFKNSTMMQNLYFYGLTQLSIDFLIGAQIIKEGSRATPISRFKKVNNLPHHLEVQRYLLINWNRFDQVFWEGGFYFRSEHHRPDAIYMAVGKEHKVAIEYERWVKDSRRVFDTFYRNAINIDRNKLYQGVIYMFYSEDDMQTYSALFDHNEWPRYEKDQRGNLKKTMMNYSPSAEVRNCFRFRVMNFEGAIGQ